MFSVNGSWRIRSVHRRRRCLRGTMLPARWNTGILSSSAATLTLRPPPSTRSHDSTSYHASVPGKYTLTLRWDAEVTGLTRMSEPTIHWSSISYVAASSGYSTHIGRMTGVPVRWLSKNVVYLSSVKPHAPVSRGALAPEGTA